MAEPEGGQLCWHPLPSSALGWSACCAPALRPCSRCTPSLRQWLLIYICLEYQPSHQPPEKKPWVGHLFKKKNKNSLKNPQTKFFFPIKKCYMHSIETGKYKRMEKKLLIVPVLQRHMASPTQ